MKTLLSILIFMLCHLSSGAQVLEKGDFLPQAGDCYQKVMAEAGPGGGGDDCIWYYSAAASGETDLSSVVAKPGGFSMLSRDWQMHYVLQGDSLLETGRENRLSQTFYLTPVVSAVYPLAPKDGFASSLRGVSSYGDRLHVGFRGFATASVDGTEVLTDNLSSSSGEELNQWNIHSPSTGLQLGTSVSTVGRSQRVATFTYDDLGRIVENLRGGEGGTLTTGYTLHGSVSSICSGAFSQRLYYAEGPDTPCWNGNVSAMSWSSPYYLSGRLCGYLYSYDRLNRLTEATYGENTTLLSNPNRYTERVVEYSSNGAMKRFQRHGLKNDGVYGKIDNLHIALEGNRIASVIDDAGYVTRAGANDFRQGADNRMTYNAAGALLSDGNRGIARIDYDRFGRPRRAQFTSGSLTEWVYTAAGDKIRTIHTTVADGVTVPLGGEVEITPAMVLHSDTTEYAGEFVWENGRIKRALYPGGFASYDDAGNCTFNYYTADHVGNVRAVTDEYGTVVQRTDYYPFGSVIADRGFGSGVQPYKTAGKETDLMHGLDVTDFGARLYNPTLPQWDRPDDHASSYSQYSPYIYCADNPVNIVDPDGRDAQIIIEGNNITIKANIILSGARANDELAKIFQKDIDNKWGVIKKVRYKGQVYSVKWDINVRKAMSKEKNKRNGVNNYLKVEYFVRSNVKGTYRGQIKSKFNLENAADSPMSHEFGHILGLRDRYVENEQDPTDQNAFRPVSEEWRGNIMYETPGNPSTVDSKNLTPLLKPALDIHNSKKGVKFGRYFPGIAKFLGINKTTYQINNINREKK